LGPKKTSPYKSCQFGPNDADDDAKNWSHIFTLKSKEEIPSISAHQDATPHTRAVQKALANDVTIRTHSANEYETAIKTSEYLCGNGSLAFLMELEHDSVLEVVDGVPQFEISRDELTAGINVLDFLAVNTQVFPSKGEARKMLQGGGVAINKEKINDIELLIDTSHLIKDKYLVAQRGKKNYFLIIVA